MAVRSRYGRRQGSVPAPISTQVYRIFMGTRPASDVPCPALRPVNYDAIPSCTTLVNHVFCTGQGCENAACVMLADLAFHGTDPSIPYDTQPEITFSPQPILEARLANFCACIADLGRVAVSQHRMVWAAVSGLDIREQNRLLQLFPGASHGDHNPVASELNDEGARVLLACITSAISMRALCERDILFLSAVLAGEIADLVAQAHILREHLAKLRLLERELYHFDMLEHDLGVTERLEPNMVAVYKRSQHQARVEYAREFFATGTGVEPIDSFRFDVFDKLSARVIAANEWFDDQKARFRQEFFEDEAVELPAWWIDMRTEPLRERNSFKPWGHFVGVEGQFGPVEEDDAEARVKDEGVGSLLPKFTFNDEDDDDEDEDDEDDEDGDDEFAPSSAYSARVSSVWEKQGIFVSPHSPLTPDTRAPGDITNEYSSLALRTPCMTSSSFDIQAATGADEDHHQLWALTLFNEGQNESDSDFSYTHTPGAAYAGIASPLLVSVHPPTPEEIAAPESCVKDVTSVERIDFSDIDLLGIKFALDVSPVAANVPLPPSPPDAPAESDITEWTAGMLMAEFAFTFASVPLPGVPVAQLVSQTKQPPWHHLKPMRLKALVGEATEAALENEVTRFYQELEHLDLNSGRHAHGKRKAADFDGGMTCAGVEMKKARTW